MFIVHFVMEKRTVLVVNMKYGISAYNFIFKGLFNERTFLLLKNFTALNTL
jgi:hypothetical protein